MALVLYLAIYPALWVIWAQIAWRRTGPYTSGGTLWLAGELASGWILLEWVRGWLFTGLTWNWLGVALHTNLPMMQGARLGGVLLLSWLIVFLNVIGVLTLIRFWAELRGQQKMRAHLDLSIGMLLIALLFGYGFRAVLQDRPEESQRLRCVLVQPNIRQSLENPPTTEEAMEQLGRLSDLALAAQPELMIWPETPVGQSVFQHPLFSQTVQRVRETGTLGLLIGSLDQREQAFYNCAVYFPARGEEPQMYDKNHLVPFGEYTPLAQQWPWLRRLMPFSIDFSAGQIPQVFEEKERKVRFAPLICFEDTLPDYVRSVAALQPDFLVNVTNDGWFPNSPAAVQHFVNAKFRAVETDLPLLRCGNTGVTAVVGATGSVESTLTMEGQSVGVSGILSHHLRWHASSVTPYERWGNWIVILAGVWWTTAMLWRRFAKAKTQFCI